MITHWIKDSKGKEYPIAFTQAVWSMLAVEENIAADMINKFMSDFGKWPMARIYRAYYLAIKTASIEVGRDFEMDHDRFMIWISNDEMVMPQIMKAMGVSLPEEDGSEKKTNLKQARKLGK